MKLIRASATLIDPPPYPLAQLFPQHIEAIGRTCYQSHKKAITKKTSAKFVRELLRRGHESVIEHLSLTAKFIVDRGVSHEIVRHRLASYSQESTRYCDYNKDGHITFIVPPWVPTSLPLGTYNISSDCIVGIESKAIRTWLLNLYYAEDDYKLLRGHGWSPQQARSVLPNALKTELIMTANLREWRHFFKLRCAPAAHPQMREVAINLLYKVQHQVPVIFDDIMPGTSSTTVTGSGTSTSSSSCSCSPHRYWGIPWKGWEG